VIGGNTDVWHYSPLKQINSGNVSQLGLAWMADMPSRDGLVGNPLVKDGVVYQSGPFGRIYANDVTNGKQLWVFSPDVNFSAKKSVAAFYSLRVSRGLSLLGDHVFVASGDCRLFAVDRRTGKEVWRTVTCDSTKQMGISGAPRVGDGKVFMGNSCVDSGTERGYVDAYDAKTGKQVWRFYTMPGDPSKPFESKAMEMASKTWGTNYWEKTHGCVSPYDAMTYDEKLHLLYIGTGSASPFNPLERALDAGDELFSDSIVAVNASTGEYVWHYQTVQHDGWDLDATWQISIAELPVQGVKRRVVMTAPKNGFFYVLDAKTGKFLSAGKYTDINWASHIDPKTGRPVTLPDARYWEHPKEITVTAPGIVGAHNWQADSFDPATGLMYMHVIHTQSTFRPSRNAVIGQSVQDLYFTRNSDPRWEVYGELIAWDPLAQAARWRIRRKMPIPGGTLATAGNLVLQGTAEGTFDAFAADTGERLWSFNTHASIEAAPTAVEVGGEQVILVASGDSGTSGLGGWSSRWASTPESRGPPRLLAFKIGGTKSLPPTVVRELPKPPLPRPDAKLASDGQEYFDAEFCTACHGLAVESGRSSVPDLRFASTQTHEQLAAIVIGGARRDKGMPGFPNISSDELRMLQAYILDEAWRAYDDQETRKAGHN
jgi:quinohemoprotein ethanol dehydrogenase